MEYLYDGTFDGLLTCLYEHVYTEKADDIRVLEENVQLSLGRQMQVKTDLTKSEKVAKAIEKKISPAALRRAYRAYLTAEKGKEMDVLRYVFLGFKLGRDVDRLHGSETVRRIDVLNHKVSWEADRILGILRFSVIEGPDGKDVLYAAIHPNCDLIQSTLWPGVVSVCIFHARLASDRESRRDRQADVRHLGEVCTFAADHELHVLVAFGNVVALCVMSELVHALDCFSHFALLLPKWCLW